jgi:hypothetical protein
LTEEWGDASKAEERRKELERLKADKLAEARDKQRKDSLASLSLLRGSLASYTGDKGQISYQNRLRKAAMLEKSLLSNPAFTEHGLAKTPVPFLYAKDSDTVIRKGDMLIIRGKPYEVVSLNFKRREFTSKPSWEKRGSRDSNRVMPANRLADDDTFSYFPQPGREERKFIASIHTDEFYRHPDTELQEKYYHTHLKCAVSSDYHPPFFAANEEGKLAVNEARCWNYSFRYSGRAYNPFSVSGMAAIQVSAKNGIEVDNAYRLEEYSALFRDCLPELAFLLYEAVPQDEETLAESA